MDVRLLEHPDDYPRWDDFVSTCAEATFFHLAGWRDVITSAFRHPVHFLFAERRGVVTGVLPMAHVRSRLFGPKLVSLPFCVYGGVAAADEESRAALLGRAGELARRLGVDFLELRNRTVQGALPVSNRYVTFRRALDPDPDKNMNAIPRKQRAMIRKGAARGLAARHDATTEEFYAVYAESLRNLGTPVLPLRYFTALRRVFGETCGVTAVRAGDGPPVAAVMSFYFRDEVLPYYGGGTARARETAAFDFMYWELLVHALARGSRVFDFGRSRQGTGSYRFKTHWGFEPEPLSYQYDLVRSATIPNLTPDNPRYQVFIKVWQRLPIPVTTRLGPWLAKDLG